ncbi:mismatch-specific DNA-glycosylase [Brevibacillus reuszeri]|uniref:DNA glycosylase n=1 Tax=Brevibacillus reuszeri TaxID=54915 RepID=A0A0K9YSZ2_9BACL|nr:mismatch-specific DNA-glycosylase [Brevibacillus reuszeri]KNB71310.1 DNA glycosylase [Brevibacillus reuszeri]MED1857752.1 mismatch-specific DNA-glycosylase [Brevibacillus reuszeri]GED66417.1 mismatch-specific DNA-glycosylase [Brevibacillus reuszeri]
MVDFMEKWLPTYIRRDLAVLFCGINPGRVSATAGYHYANPANLFWRGLFEGGLTPRKLLPEETSSLLDYNYGITDLVSRPTRSSTELREDDYATGAAHFVQMIQTYRPRVICFNGITAFRHATGQKKEAVTLGLQPEQAFGTDDWKGSYVFVIPSTSGANASFTREERIAKFGELSVFLRRKDWHPLPDPQK